MKKTKKSNTNWIGFIVVAFLLLLFLDFISKQKPESGKQKAESGKRKSESGKRKSKSGNKSAGAFNKPRQWALAILGVEEGATMADIKRAWKSEQKKHHPDLGGDVKKSQEANEAYEILKEGK